MVNYSDLLVSFFSLVKSNNGFFKSEKQAAFLLKMTSGHYVTTQNIRFGEFEGRTNRNTAQVEWVVDLDTQGVTKMVKNTSKGSQVYFERTQEFFDKIAAKKATMLADVAATIKGRNDFLNNKINEAKTELKELKKELSTANENKDFLLQQPSPLTSCSNLYEYIVKVSNKSITALENEIEGLEAEIK